MSNRQTLQNKMGEVLFRRKLVEQQLYRESHFDDEFDREEIEAILETRMLDTFHRMQEIGSRGITLEPYVEIGAERGQRSLVMENDIHTHGAAVDLSLEMLQSCDYYARRFDKERLPLRICADLYDAPFKSDSIPFVFAYQTLHHFPDPDSIGAVIHRFLATDGFFLFDEEPFKRELHLNLYRTAKAYSKHSRVRGMARKVLDALFAERTCNEVDYGIVENDEISIADWRKVVAPFATKSIRLKSAGGIDSSLDSNRINPQFWINRLLGGVISGYCRKAGSPDKTGASSIEMALTCPECLNSGSEPDICLRADAAVCSRCGMQYPVVKGVVVMLTRDRRRELYPDIG